MESDQKVWKIRGKVIFADGKPVANVLVQAMESDQQWFDDRNDDHLGSTWVKEDGTFQIRLEEKHFKENILEGKPDIYLIVRNSVGEIIHTTEVRKGVKPSEIDALTFNISLDSLEKKVQRSDDPYEHNNERVVSSFQNIGESIDISNSDTARILSLLLRTMSDWQLYTQENAWNVRGYDGPQVPRYPWKQAHNHKLRWEV